MNRGTAVQYNTEHAADCALAGIPAEGKVGFVNGVPAPDTQRTMKLYDAFQNPDNSDDYIWRFTGDDVATLGWIR